MQRVTKCIKNKIIKINPVFLVAIILVLSIMSALVFEILCFNRSALFQQSYQEKIIQQNIELKGIERQSDGSFLVTNKEASLTLHFDEKFVKQLAYKLEIITGTDISYEIIVNNKNMLNYLPEKTYAVNIEDKDVNINQKTDQILFSFKGIENFQFRLEDIFISNQFVFNPIRFITLYIFSMIILITIAYLVREKEVPLEKIALLAILGFGGLLVFLTPVNATWDEQFHLIRIVNNAQGNFIFKNTDYANYPTGYDFLRTKQTAFVSFEEFKKIYTALYQFDFSNLEYVVKESTAATYTFVPYLMAGVGCKIATVLKLPIIYCVWFSRLFNVLFYALCVFLAIKIIPYNKALMFLLALMPTCLILSISLCVDIAVIGLLLVLFAGIIKVSTNETGVTISRLILFWIGFVLIGVSKMAYMPLIFLMFLIPKEQYKSRTVYVVSILITVILCITVIVGIYLYGNWAGLSQWKIEGVDTLKQISFILHSPLQYLNIILDCVTNNFIPLFTSCFFSLSYSGGVNSFINAWVVIVLIITVLSGQTHSFLLSKQSRTIIILNMFLIVGISLTALYVTFNPVGSLNIEGFQGRYLIPALIPFFFIWPGKKYKLNYEYSKLTHLCVWTMIITLTVVVLSILMLYWM